MWRYLWCVAIAGRNEEVETLLWVHVELFHRLVDELRIVGLAARVPHFERFLQLL